MIQDSLSTQPNTYAESDLVCIDKWNVNGLTVKWLQKNTQKEIKNYISIFENNITTLEEQPGPIGFKKQMRIDDDGSLEFCPVKFRKNFENVELCLLVSDRKGLVWQLFDKVFKETKWQNFSATFASDYCHKKTWKFFEKYKFVSQINIQNLENFDDNFLIRDIVLFKKTEVIEEPKHIDLESISDEAKKEACDRKEKRAWEKTIRPGQIYMQYIAYSQEFSKYKKKLDIIEQPSSFLDFDLFKETEPSIREKK